MQTTSARARKRRRRRSCRLAWRPRGSPPRGAPDAPRWPESVHLTLHRRPAADGSCCATPQVLAWARCALANASSTYRSAKSASAAASARSLRARPPRSARSPASASGPAQAARSARVLPPITAARAAPRPGQFRQAIGHRPHRQRRVRALRPAQMRDQHEPRAAPAQLVDGAQRSADASVIGHANRPPSGCRRDGTLKSARRRLAAPPRRGHRSSAAHRSSGLDPRSLTRERRGASLRLSCVHQGTLGLSRRPEQAGVRPGEPSSRKTDDSKRLTRWR